MTNEHAVTADERKDLQAAAKRTEERLRDEAAIAEGTDQEKLEAFARWVDGIRVPSVSNCHVTLLLRQQLAAVVQFARFAAR